MSMEHLVADEADTVERPRVDDSPAATPRFARGTLEIDRGMLRANEDAELHEGALVEIVHDLKAPLATMALELALLDQRLAGDEAVAARPVLARLMQNVDFLDRMVQDLLDAWMPEPSRGLRAPTDVRDLLELVIARAVPTPERARVQLEAPRTVVLPIDDLRIQRVVANLLSNALKYSRAKSAILVRLELRRDHACVSVTDAGHGLTRTEAGYIFDKYRRTQSARLQHGSGLGLFVSRNIVEAHGGSMGVESTPGVGSRFFFELPLT